jgi:hypothetical protein
LATSAQPFHLLQRVGLDQQAGAVRVLGVPAALEERVPDALHVVGADARPDARARRVEGGHGAAADRLQVDALAGVALGVDVGDVLAGDVERAPLRPERRRRRVEAAECAHFDSSLALVDCVRTTPMPLCELASSFTGSRPG